MLFGKTFKNTATKGINSTDTPVMIIHGVNDESISYYGSSIISHQSEITNPNILYTTYRTENHDGHNNLVTSDAAIAYITNKNLEYKEIFDTYKGKIPDSIRQAYYEGIDRFQTSEIDVKRMNAINTFFEMHRER